MGHSHDKEPTGKKPTGREPTDREQKGPRCIAIVGPYLSGKTSLLEALLFSTNAIGRQGKVSEGNTIGDAIPEARNHGMSVELNVASTSFMGEEFCFVDCPGSVEFSQEARAVLSACDAAIVVCEVDEKKVPALQVILKELDALGLPRFLFINKIDKSEMRLRDVLAVIQPASARPLVLRQVPIWKNGIVTGFIDLALERAFVYREHAHSEVIEMPAEMLEREQQARFEMLEKMADYDDDLLEQLLSDMEPPKDKVFDDLSRELAQGQITPVLFGSAENSNGILRLLKALRHEVRDISTTAERLDLAPGSGVCAQVMKTYHTPHGGQLSLVRVLRGEFEDGTVFYGGRGQDVRCAGLFNLTGIEPEKISKAGAGATLALGRLEGIKTGETISDQKGLTRQLAMVEQNPPVYGLAVTVNDRKDEVKLAGAAAKLLEEDTSLALEHNQHTHEMVLWGQGEMHLRVALERLKGKFGIDAQLSPRNIAYKESIRKATSVRGRYKKQSGGHGQFGDVMLDISPLPRGGGFEFSHSISGGVVPKQYFSAVEAGVKEYMIRGPLGFPVIDIAVNLSDGSYHSVDSSDMAFKQAARQAMSEGMEQCAPVLLEPIVAVVVHCPSDTTSRINQIVTGHRGQLLGFDARPGWPGWDAVQAYMPEAEISRLIIELRSATAGVGSFTFTQDHLHELNGNQAAEIVDQHKVDAA